MRLNALLLACLLCVTVPPGRAGDTPAPMPLPAANLSPLVHSMALPRDTALAFRPLDSATPRLSLDVASHFTSDRHRDTDILLDGETYRTTFALRGRRDRLAWRLALPWVAHNGGFLDGPIENWHAFFGLPPGGRPRAPRDRILFRVREGREEVLRLDRPVSGPGDVAGTLGYRLTQPGRGLGLALGGRLEAPTGDRDRLLGNGGWDGALWLSARHTRSTTLGRFALSASGGMVASGRAPALAPHHRSQAGFGRLFAGWGPTDALRLGAQTDFHQPFYRPPLAPLGQTAVELRLHGGIRLGPALWLEAGFSEDLMVATAPDITFHLALSREGG